jgi:hypothetical protein
MFNRIGCYLSGHDYGIKSEGGRMYLRCESCGRTSDGWSLDRGPNEHMRATRAVAMKPTGAREATRAVAR